MFFLPQDERRFSRGLRGDETVTPFLLSSKKKRKKGDSMLRINQAVAKVALETRNEGPRNLV